jgi:acetylornithine deacetylase
MDDNSRAAGLTRSSISLLKELVAFDTVSRHSNLALIEYIEAYLARYGVPHERIPNAHGDKSNLLARIGPEAPGGIIFSGHSDVVPVDGQQWTSPPFVLTEREGKLYGRGAADMKGFVAIMLAFVQELTRRELSAPVYLAISYDEEVGCLGAPDLVRRISERADKPRLCVIGEPTGMQVVTSHKGVYSFETVVTGHEAHSSQPHLGVNAVHIGCELVRFLCDLAEEYRVRGISSDRFEPPHSTIHVGVIEGGTARNIIPKRCRFVWEVRPIPGDRAENVVQRFEAFCEKKTKEMQSRFPGTGIVTTMMSRMQGMQLSVGPEEEAHILSCARVNATYAVSFGTEAGVFQEHGIPVVVCGPGYIDQAHQPDEFVELAQMEKCVRFLLRLLDTITEPA